jgi:hypothetical protein
MTENPFAPPQTEVLTEESAERAEHNQWAKPRIMFLLLLSASLAIGAGYNDSTNQINIYSLNFAILVSISFCIWAISLSERSLILMAVSSLLVSSYLRYSADMLLLIRNQ